MKHLISSLLAVQICALSLQARTPQEIKAVLQSICPKDTIVKAAYLKDGTPASFATQTSNANVYVVSSEDGVLRKVNTVKGSLMMVNITADGKRVLYWDKNSSRTYVVNWDGTNERVVISSGMLLEYWRDRTAGTDWAIIENGGQSRIDIDNTATSVKLTQSGCGGLGGGLSDDGTRAIVHTDNGWGTVAVGSVSVQYGSGGCQASMRAGPIAQWSCNESGHESAFVNNPDGSVAFKILMGSPILDTGGEGARFTQHPNYFTFMGASWGLALSLNPIIFRVSDTVRIGIEDNVPNTMFCGDVDAVFLPASSVVSKGNQLLRPAYDRRSADVRAETFTFAGRRLPGVAAKTRAVHGVVLLGGGRAQALDRVLLVD